MKKTFKILVTLVLLPVLVLAQQSDSSSLENAARQIYQMDSIQRADSLRRRELQREIDQLKGLTNTEERKALMRKLNRIEQEDSIKKTRQSAQLQKLKDSAKGFPVTPFEDTLFMIYTRIGSFTAKDRAAAISRKIEALYDDIAFNPDSLKINSTELSAEVFYNDLMIMSVNEMEALWYGRSANVVAGEHLQKIKEAIQEERKANSIINLVLRIGAIVLILVGIYVVIRLINSGFKKINAKIISLKEKVLKGIKFRGYQFLDTERELKVILFTTNIVRLLVIVLALYVALPLLFSVFPCYRIWRPTVWITREAVVESTALYWHFMDGLWVYLVLLLAFWR
jgi:hypothetical protein